MRYKVDMKAGSTLLLSASLLALGLAQPAMAQDTAQAAPQTADEGAAGDIVVTAQFRSQRLQDTPLSITAMNADLLNARSQTDVAQVAGQAPNVTLTPMGSAYGASMGASIRGVGQFDFNPAYEPGVGMYIDDVYYATLTGGNFDLLDLERVEVLRGPQGTLTGRNSIGGAIKLFSRKPNGDNGGSVEATYGSRHRVDVRGSADFTLADGLYGRVAGVYKRQDGYVDMVDYGCAHPGNAEGIAPQRAEGSCVVDTLGGRSYVGVRGTLRYDPGTGVEVIINTDYTNEDRTNSADVATTARNPNFICGDRCTYASWFLPAAGAAAAREFPHRTTFDGWGISGHVNIDLTDSIQLQSITAYRHYKTTWGTDDDYTPDVAIGAGGYNRLTHRFFSQELRLNASLGDMIDVTLGGFYSDQKSIYYTIQDIRYTGPLQFYGDDPINASSKAVFGTAIIKPLPDFTVTAGLRYTDEEKDYTFARRTYAGAVHPILGALDGFTSRYAGDRIDWRVSADYRFSPEVLAYATVSTGFKGGGVSARPFNVTQAQNGSFGPETLTAYELGLKTDLFDRALRLNIAGFINSYKSVQLALRDCTAYGGGPCGVVANAGDATFRGIEAELQAEPVDGLSIDGSASYLEADWKKGSLSPALGTSVLEIDRATSAPKWKFSGGIQYKAELGDAGSLTPRFDIAYTGRRFGGRAVLNTPYNFDNYTIANARLTWRNVNEDLEVALEVQNLFDEYYYPSRFDAIYQFTGTVYNNVGRPREWAVTVKKRF